MVFQIFYILRNCNFLLAYLKFLTNSIQLTVQYSKLAILNPETLMESGLERWEEELKYFTF
jgi:hypothetical protein